ncbi:MAG: DsbA family protein [Trueperaceae bacterium]
MTPTNARPRTTRRASWFTTLLLALAPFAFAPMALAQVGQPVPALLEALALTVAQDADENADTVLVVTEEGRSLTLKPRGTALYAVAGDSVFDAEAIAEVAAVIAVATGYGDGIEGPVRGFFEQNLPDLAGLGPRTIRIEAFLLDLEVRGDAAPYEVAWSLELAAVDEEAFPEARHAKGPADARYVIREFSDLQCPFCARFAADVLPALEAELLARGDVRFEYHHLPLVSIHANAFRAAEASECVVDANPDDADAFWAYTDALFERMQAWDALGDPDAYFANLAGQIGLSGAGVAACLAAGTHTRAVGAATDAALALGLSGTPTVFVGPYRLQDFNRVQGYLDAFGLIDAFADTLADAE